MTKPVYNRLDDFYELTPEKGQENYDDIGKVEYAVFYPPAELIGVSHTPEENARVMLSQRLRWYLRLDVIGLLDILGIRKLRGRFLHLPANLSS